MDLGAATHVTASEIYWENNQGAYQYRVEISDDGASWAPLVDRSGNALAAVRAFDTFDATGRYLRVTVDGLPDGSWASIWEWHVYGP